MDSISLNHLQLDCIIGIYSQERKLPQPLQCSVTAWLDLRQACHSGQIQQTLDYGRLYGEIRFILLNGNFKMLETAADALARYILAPPLPTVKRPQIAAVDVQLSKLKALDHTTVADIQIHRQHSDFAFTSEKTEFGCVDLIHESIDCGLYRLRIAPYGEIPAHFHNKMHEAEMALTEGLLLQETALEAGLMRCWPKGFVHRYQNMTAEEQVILCLDRPRFNRDDEVPSHDPLGDLTQVPVTKMYPPF